MQFKSFMEALKGKQHKIDKNKNGQIDAHDFKLLRKEESEESAETIEESEERMARADYKVGASGRKSHKEIVFNDAESKDDDKKEMKEAKMSDADMAERERIVKGMKKNLAGFKARYGKDAKSVMYATATKQAMKEETVEEAVQKADIPAYLRKQQGQTPLKLSDLKRKDTISDKENLAKLRNEELDESVFADKEQAQAMASKLKTKHEDGNYSVVADHGKHRVVHSYHSDSRVKKDIAKLNEELDEAFINGREYASHGLMHPDHAKWQSHRVSVHTDFYAHGTGDKINGQVVKNDGKEVHIKATKSSGGKLHKFKVTPHLPQQQNEEKKDDVPFDGPYTKTKPVKNSDGSTQQPMSRARELAKQGIAASRMDQQAKRKIKEAKDEQEYGYEGDMAMNQLSTLIRCAEMIKDTLKPDTDLPEWVQSKITLASDYIVTAADYLHSELEEGYYEKPASAYRRKGDEIGAGSNAPVAPVPDKKYIKGTPEHKAYKATKKPINGMPTGNMKESFDSDGNIINSKVSYKDFAMMLEYETKDGRYVHKGTYGGNYVDPEGADDADDKKPKQQPAEKRGRGRPAGAKSGARKITGTSKLFK